MTTLAKSASFRRSAQMARFATFRSKRVRL